MDNQMNVSPFNGVIPPPQAFHSTPAAYSAATTEQPTTMPREVVSDVPAHGSAQQEEAIVENEIIVDDSFSYDGFQVVRGEYFSHINEPSITFSDNRFSINAACLKKAPDTEFVQVLVNQDERKLAIRPCSEDVKDSFSWCTLRRKPKKVICPLFFGKVMSMMGWNPEHRYKIIGKLICSQGQYLFVFDLNSPEIYKRSVQIDENGVEKRKSSRKPTYLDSWKDQFGVSVEEHQKALQINIFDGYALIGVKEPKHQAPPTIDHSEEVDHAESEAAAVHTDRFYEAQDPHN